MSDAGAAQQEPLSLHPKTVDERLVHSSQVCKGHQKSHLSAVMGRTSKGQNVADFAASTVDMVTWRDLSVSWQRLGYQPLERDAQRHVDNEGAGWSVFPKKSGKIKYFRRQLFKPTRD